MHNVGINIWECFNAIEQFNLHSHDLRVPVGSVSRFKLSLPQCDLPELHIGSFKRVF